MIFIYRNSKVCVFDEIFTRVVKAPNFLPGFDWINTKEPLSLEKLKGHVVVLDFWTYCCINCMHTLPVLAELEKKYEESQKEAIEDTIDTLLEKNTKSGTLSKEPLKIEHIKIQDKTLLSYPGKISISKDGKIAVSDSNHNRILVTDLSGKIEFIIGNGKNGFSDGDFNTATFFRPQGVLWKNNSIFVADTENHAIRKIDLQNKQVTTLVGTGKQGPWVSRGGKGRETAITSPWDLAEKNNLIFIAMAGNHQIWSYDLESDLARPFAGNGHENIIDGENHMAQLAQPSGLSIYGNKLYFADSEVSAIREIDLEKNQVKTIVGHGLFVFGHHDGHVDEALFQHPLGVFTYENKVYVADTYNSAIRVIDLQSNQVSTLIGKSGMNGACRLDDPKCDTLGLYEPSDVELFGDKLYISDTNNHLIRVYNMEKNVLETLRIT